MKFATSLAIFAIFVAGATCYPQCFPLDPNIRCIWYNQQCNAADKPCAETEICCRTECGTQCMDLGDYGERPDDRAHRKPNPRVGCPALDDRAVCKTGEPTCDSDAQCTDGHICCPSACPSGQCMEPIE